MKRLLWRRRSISQRGSDIEQPVEVSLEDAYVGSTRLLEIRSMVICPQCKGKKRRYILIPCRACQRQGVVPSIRRMEVRIPAGVQSGTRIRIPGGGSPAVAGGAHGDLFLVIDIQPDPLFERKGDDLYMNVDVEEEKALAGCEIQMMTPDKRMLGLKIPPGTTDNCSFRLAHQGMPSLNGGSKGHLFVNVAVQLSRVKTSVVAGVQAAPAGGSGAPRASIGHYIFKGLLGSGGFADVYLAEHEYLKTQVAIKVVRSTATSQHLQSFIKEAQMIATLKHPSIIRLLDFGLEDTKPYLVMEYASDGTLRDRHPESTRISLETLLPYVQQVASALQYAHERKLIHRDIKPENMLVTAEGNILLSDFGIAVASHTTQSMTTQEAIGTVLYMAPEQIRGKPQTASDQYSLGVVVYEWLCGEPPFDGQTSVEIAISHLTEAPPALQSKTPGIHPAVEQIVLRALEKEPRQRFRNVQDFADALTRAYQST